MKNGYDINSVDKDGLCAIHIAIEQENISLIEFLLERGADINFEREGYYTPIEYASLVPIRLLQGRQTKNINYSIFSYS